MKSKKLVKETYRRWAWKDSEGNFDRTPSGRIKFTDSRKAVAVRLCCADEKPVRVRVTIEEIR